MQSKRWMRVWSLSLTILVGLAGCGDGKNKINNNSIEEQTSNTNVLTSNKVTNEKAENKEGEKDVLEIEEHQEEMKVQDSIDKENQKEQTSEGEKSLFADMSGYHFWFASGVGGWSTELRIEKDGAFSGIYHDNDMGDTGEEYPNGTVYHCNFVGRFTTPKKINEYTYKMNIEYMDYEEKDGEEELVDGRRFFYVGAYGLEDAEDLYIYLPGSPTKELPEEYMNWPRMNTIEDSEKLQFYGIFNEKAEAGFIGYKDPERKMADELAEIEQKEKKLTEGIESMSQQDMNRTYEEIYTLWDDELNSIWKRIKERIDEERMKELTKEEKDWIEYKEARVKRAGEEFLDGSAQPMAEYSVAARLTKERVYELAEMLY